MGTGGSFLRHNDEDDVLGTEYGRDGVIKRIPIEVKPRGKLGLRTVNSFGKKQKGGSLRSALSVELENPEVEKIRKEFEMYRLQNENEIANLVKKDQRLEQENRRLRSELLALKKTCQKLKDERESVLEVKDQALARASAFETDRDKIQRQFKLFRETKENEIQAMLRARRDLETKLSKVAGAGLFDDMESMSRIGLEAIGVGGPGDWWTALESEPSLGSTTQLNSPIFKGPEFAHSMIDTEGPFTNVNKDDWTQAAASLAHVMPTMPEMLHTNTVTIYISAAPDCDDEVNLFMQDWEAPLYKLCKGEGRFFTIIALQNEKDDEKNMDLMDARRKRIEQSSIFVAFLGRNLTACTESECHWGHLDSPGSKSSVFCFREEKKNKRNNKVEQLRRQVIDSGSVRLIENYNTPQQGVQLAGQEVERLIRLELGIESQKERDVVESVLEYEGPEVLCGGCLWDPKNDYEQHQSQTCALRSTCELKFERVSNTVFCWILVPARINAPSNLLEHKTFVSWEQYFDDNSKGCVITAGGSLGGTRVMMMTESCLTFNMLPVTLFSQTCKYYERLYAHVAAPGPQPPLLITGSPGIGRSLLFSKWIELQQQRQSGGLVLYHFVSNSTSVSADPIAMIRRLTAQLLQQNSTAPALTCDPVRLLEEFPRWLDKVSSKVNGGVILLLDSIDLLQQGESHLQWLLDPLPVDLRVFVSANVETCPPEWRSWPTLHMDELSTKGVRELLHAELASLGRTISPELESQITTHCRSVATCTPLYVVLLATQIARCQSNGCLSAHAALLINTTNATHLYKVSLFLISQRYEMPGTPSLLRQALSLIYASRNGLNESELMATVKGLTWQTWLPLRESLLDCHVLTTRSDLFSFAHQQAAHAVYEMYFDGDDDGDGTCLELVRRNLRDYFAPLQSPLDVTYRVADELPWLNKQLGDKAALEESILNLCIFLKLYGRGRCFELIGYWSFLGKEKTMMARMYQGSLKMMEQMVGQFDGMVTLPRIADCYEALGRFLRDLAMLTEALTPLQRALEIRETALDPDHPSVAQTLHQVAGVHAQQGRFSAAEALYKQALEIYEGAFGREHYLVAKELDALAVLYQKQGKHEVAEPVHRRAVSIRRRSKMPRVSSELENPRPAASGLPAPAVAPQEGHMRCIEPLKRRTLQLEELTIGQDSPDLARALNELGVLNYLQNNVETAESFFRRALEMREGIQGEDHGDLAQSLNNLAALYNDTQQYDKARHLYERALAIRRKVYPPEHPSIASVINHLAMLYKKMGLLDLAEPLYKQSVEIREHAFGPNHPAVATALVNLAVLYSQQGQHTSAEPLYERALLIYESSFGRHHARVAETLKNMALLKYEQGDFETAASLYKRATEIKENDLAYAAKVTASRRSSTGDTAS